MLVIDEIVGQYCFMFSLNPFVVANDVPPPGDGKGLVN